MSPSSFGIVLAEIATSKIPFEGETEVSGSLCKSHMAQCDSCLELDAPSTFPEHPMQVPVAVPGVLDSS